MIFSNNIAKWLRLRNGLILRYKTPMSKPIEPPILIRRWNHVDVKKENDPVKFTSSEANINYRASLNFYGDTRDLPDSNNVVVATSSILALIYMFFLRDDIENDGGANLFKPVHETIPELAIPLLRSAIAENKRFGQNTQKLEMKLAEYMKEPEKYGGDELTRRKLVEN